MARKKDDRILKQVIRDHLNETGLSQRAFGQQVGVDQSRVSVWIRGNEMPRPDNLPALASALGMTEDDLAAIVNRSRKPQTLGPATYAQRLGEVEQQVAQHHDAIEASTETLEKLTAEVAELKGMVKAFTETVRKR